MFDYDNNQTYYFHIDVPVYNTQTALLQNEIHACLQSDASKGNRYAKTLLKAEVSVGHNRYGSFTFGFWDDEYFFGLSESFRKKVMEYLYDLVTISDVLVNYLTLHTVQEDGLEEDDPEQSLEYYWTACLALGFTMEYEDERRMFADQVDNFDKLYFVQMLKHPDAFEAPKAKKVVKKVLVKKNRELVA